MNQISVRGIAGQIMRWNVRRSLRVFVLLTAFLVALDACIALNRWWLAGGFQDYMSNLFVMVGGFTVFIVLASRSRTESVGYVLFCVAIYFVCNYEIGGPSKYYLTPFDPALGLAPAFPKGGPPFLGYRKVIAYITSILASSILAFARLKRRVPKVN